MNEKCERREGKEKYVSEDARELREVLTAIIEFLRDITGPLKELMSLVQSSIAGDKLGKDIAEFYKNLKDSGLPDDVVNELIKKYYDDRMSLLRLMSSLFEGLRRGRAIIAASRGEETKSSIKEALKEALRKKEEEE